MDFSFSDAQVVDSLDKVPQDFRGLYVEKEGKFSLDAEDPKVGAAVSAVTRLNEALKAARAEAKAKGKQAVDLSPLKDWGESPEEAASAIRAKIEELEAAAAGSKEAKLNLDKVKEELSKAHAKELSARDQKLSGYKAQLDKVLVENEAKSAIASMRGDVELLMPHLVNQVRPIEEDGEYRVYVVDKAGDKRYSGVTGQPMTIAELVSEFKASEKFGKLFESEAPSGGGIKPQPRSSTQPASRTLSSVEKISAGLSERKR